jgi:fructokinase
MNVPVVDTIGAGDTFHGGLLSWLEFRGKMSRKALGELTEEELRAALLFANKAASLVCTRRGAEPPSMAEVEALAPENDGNVR